MGWGWFIYFFQRREKVGPQPARYSRPRDDSQWSLVFTLTLLSVILSLDFNTDRGLRGLSTAGMKTIGIYRVVRSYFCGCVMMNKERPDESLYCPPSIHSSFFVIPYNGSHLCSLSSTRGLPHPPPLSSLPHLVALFFSFRPLSLPTISPFPSYLL